LFNRSASLWNQKDFKTKCLLNQEEQMSRQSKDGKEFCEITIPPILSFPHKEGRDYMKQSCLHSLLVDVDKISF
jgi:hypothetical protein